MNHQANSQAELEKEVQVLRDTSRLRQAAVVELRILLEDERARWEGVQNAIEEAAKDEAKRFKAQEDLMLQEIRRLNDELNNVQEKYETRNSVLDRTVKRLEQENRKLQAALKAEESLSEALRERVQVLVDELSKVEEGSRSPDGQVRRAPA